MPSTYKESKIEYKYSELPDEPKYKKKKQKITIKKSKHKHEYAKCLFRTKIRNCITGKADTWMYAGTYCTICGRIGDMSIGAERIIRDSVPTFDLVSWNQKFIQTTIGE